MHDEMDALGIVEIPAFDTAFPALVVCKICVSRALAGDYLGLGPRWRYMGEDLISKDQGLLVVEGVGL